MVLSIMQYMNLTIVEFKETSTILNFTRKQDMNLTIVEFKDF